MVLVYNNRKSKYTYTMTRRYKHVTTTNLQICRDFSGWRSLIHLFINSGYCLREEVTVIKHVAWKAFGRCVKKPQHSVVVEHMEQYFIATDKKLATTRRNSTMISPAPACQRKRR